MFNTEGLCLKCMNDNGGEKICPICGFDNSTPNPSDCLPVKSVVQNRYLLGTVLKRDGEGITYMGWDQSRMAKIEVKEYFPSGFAHRNPDKTVAINQSGKYTFNEGLLEFIDINRAILLSTLPSLLKVLDVFEENGTAYAVFEHISAITLEEFLQKNGGALKWEQARPFFLPVIDTVYGMNEMGYIHGGISTDTILVGRDGKLRISGYFIKKMRRADSELESKLYSGFAACEQYGRDEMRIDTYTDVYGLCATLFRVMIGSVPPEAPERLQNDAMTIPAKFAEELPRQVLAALANGLQVRPQHRTKNIEIFKNELVYGEIENFDNTAKAPKKPTETKTSSSSKNIQSKSKNSSAKYVLISALCTVLVFVLIALVLALTVFKDTLFKKNTDSAESTVSFNAPEVVSIGTVDSGAEETEKLYPVPDFKGKYYAEIIDQEDYDMFEFIIVDKQFSADCAKGTICNQSVKPDTNVPRDTKIELTISLGPKEIKIANLKGMTEAEAKLELLKQGFLYENIRVMEKYDQDSDPGVVLEQSPEYGETINTEIIVTIYINSYKEDTSSEKSSSNSSRSSSTIQFN